MTKQTPKESKRIYVEDGYNLKHYPDELLHLYEQLSSLGDDIYDWMNAAEDSCKEYSNYAHGNEGGFNCDVSYDMIRQVNMAWDLLFEADRALRSVLGQAIIKGLSDKRPLLTEERTNLNEKRSKYLRGLRCL